MIRPIPTLKCTINTRLTMAKFQLGATVLKYDSTDRGTIVEVASARRGRQIYRVNWGSKVTDELEEDLVLDYDVSDPFERCSNAILGRIQSIPRRILPSGLRARITPPYCH